MKSSIKFSCTILLLYVLLVAFKPPKTSYPKGDILYSKYGGNVDSMLAGERKADSLARPYLYQNIFTEEKKETDNNTIDDESIILEKASSMPQFPDGEAGLKEYIASNSLLLPDSLIGQKANVLVKFYINTLGDAKDATIIKTDNPAFNTQAVLLIDGMPKWTPAKQNGKDVNCYVTIPVKFGE